jgi:hypothetical protein
VAAVPRTPALGLEEMDGGYAWAPAPDELGARWFALAPREQRAREHDYLRALLERAQQGGEAEFEAGWCGDASRTAALAERCGARFTRDETARGRMSATAVAALAEQLPEVLVIDGTELAVTTSDGWSGLGVWLDRWRAPALERALGDAWWATACEREARGTTSASIELERERDARRRRHAQLYVGWKRAGGALFTSLVAVSVALAWGDGVVDVLKAIGSIAVLLLCADWLVERWHARATRRDDI